MSFPSPSHCQTDPGGGTLTPHAGGVANCLTAIRVWRTLCVAVTHRGLHGN